MNNSTAKTPSAPIARPVAHLLHPGGVQQEVAPAVPALPKADTPGRLKEVAGVAVTGYN